LSDWIPSRPEGSRKSRGKLTSRLREFNLDSEIQVLARYCTPLKDTAAIGEQTLAAAAVPLDMAPPCHRFSLRNLALITFCWQLSASETPPAPLVNLGGFDVELE
jgi:hypothetical protein